MPSRQINEFSQKGNIKNELVARPDSTDEESDGQLPERLCGFEPVDISRIKQEAHELQKSAATPNLRGSSPSSEIVVDISQPNSSDGEESNEPASQRRMGGFEPVSISRIKQEPKERSSYEDQARGGGDSNPPSPSAEIDREAISREAKLLAQKELKALKKSVLDSSTESDDGDQSWSSDQSFVKAQKREKRLKKRSERRMAKINIATDSKLRYGH